VGRDLRPVAEVQQKLVKTQLALEKDYEVYRAFDTRYRVVMSALREAIVMLDATSGRVEDANQAAAHLLGTTPDALSGTPFAQEFEDRRQAEFMDALNGVASSGSGRSVIATARRNHTPVSIHPTLFRAAGRTALLCRLESSEEAQPVAEELSINLHALFNKGLDAVVFTDTQGMIRAANESFLNLCDVPTADALNGKSLGEFLARGGADLKILVDNAARVGRVRSF
jgi:transcriptional regulator PpsR